MDDSEVKLVNALARGFSIINAYDSLTKELSSKELTEITGLPKQTLFRMLDTLCELYVLRHNKATAKYRLHTRLLGLGSNVLYRMPVKQIARPYMQSLANYTHGQVQLTVAAGGYMNSVEVCHGQDSMLFRPEIGMPVSITKTAAGRAYFNSVDASVQAEIVDVMLRKGRDLGQFEALMQSAQQHLAAQGYTKSMGELHKEIVSIAVPMKHMVDEDCYVFSLSIPVYSELLDQLDSNLAPRLITLVKTVENAMGSY